MKVARSVSEIARSATSGKDRRSLREPVIKEDRYGRLAARHKLDSSVKLVLVQGI